MPVEGKRKRYSNHLFRFVLSLVLTVVLQCDTTEPACARCKRLRIECTGRGAVQYRFRNQFVDETAKPRKATDGHRPLSRPNRSREITRHHQLQHRPLLPLVKTPTNDTTYSVAGFISILEISDPRYDVFSMSYWLGDLPKRFGFNKALDSAIQGVVTAFPCLYSKTVTQEAVDAYEEARRYVRLSLPDARANIDTECMSALFLLQLMQDWIGKRHESDDIFHLGIAFILKGTKRGHCLSEFERAVRRTLSVCTVRTLCHDVAGALTSTN